ncbi:hypothetical protein QAD02_012865, partial [Eretmocerus hayati]
VVSTYLVHHGYCETALTFANSSGQSFGEDLASIQNRQKVLKLILSGQVGQAISLTMKLYPGLLERDGNLLFALKCRQFIEMVNGSDSEMQHHNIECAFGVIQATNGRTHSHGAPSSEITQDNSSANGPMSQLRSNGRIVSDIEMVNPNDAKLETSHSHEKSSVSANGDPNASGEDIIM